MTRWEYTRYLARRIGEALLIAGMAVYAMHLLQVWGVIRPPSHTWALRTWDIITFWDHTITRRTPLIRTIEWWTWPILSVPLVHLLFGPKQSRPIYLRIPGIMYRYAGINVDRNAGCRGGFIAGATGSGKTQICINPRNHSIALNECGIEKTSWKASNARSRFEDLRDLFLQQTEGATVQIDALFRKQEQLAQRIQPVEDALIDALFTAILEFQTANPNRPFTAVVFDSEDEDTPPEVRLKCKTKLGDDGKPVAGADGKPVVTEISTSPDDAIRILTWARNANRFGALARLPNVGGEFQRLLESYAALVAEDNEISGNIARLMYLVQVKRNDLQKFADSIKALRYRVPPFGGLVIGAKGNEWQQMVPMLHYYKRDEDIGLLQTRPDNAPENWTPPAKFNLISYTTLPASTYAQLLFATYMTISQKDEMDYFDNAARDMIGYGIDLLRAITANQEQIGIPEEQRVIPNLKLLCEIFTTLNNYNEFLTRVGAAPKQVPQSYEDQERQPDGSVKTVTKKREITIRAVLQSSKIASARKEIEGGYWGLAEETQKSVMGSIRNVLVPFTEPEVAEVFCGENTFDFREMEAGKVVCVAMPPKFAVQRQYVGTILKNLAFTIINERFALNKRDPRWVNRNLVIVDSDEHQISAGKEDQRVDIIREANGTLYAASQTRNALWKTYGGKDKATPIISNLRNVWACQAGTDECAEETAKLIGEFYQREVSYSSGNSGDSRSVSYKLNPIVSKSQLKSLSAFYVYWVPAEGKWLYKLVISMPVTPDCKIPHWWFGTWNPLHFLAFYLHLPSRLKIGKIKIPIHPGSDFIPPWKAKAPLRAQVRYLLGLDGTFIVTEKMTRKRAQRLAQPPHKT